MKQILIFGTALLGLTAMAQTPVPATAEQGKGNGPAVSAGMRRKDRKGNCRNGSHESIAPAAHRPVWLNRLRLPLLPQHRRLRARTL